MVPILEDFDGYTPPNWINPTVRRLFASVPEAHVTGLASVVLTESAKTRRIPIRRRAGKKYQANQRLGFYRSTWRGEPPGIHLVIDNILGQERGLAWIQIGRDVTLGKVLFHEIGHHLNTRVGLIAASEEESAEAWERRLMRLHLRRRYWFLRPVVPILRFVVTVLRRVKQPASSLGIR